MEFLTFTLRAVCVSMFNLKCIELINFIFGGGLPSDPGRKLIWKKKWHGLGGGGNYGLYDKRQTIFQAPVTP